MIIRSVIPVAIVIFGTLVSSCQTDLETISNPDRGFISFGIREWPASKGGALGTSSMSSFGVGAVTGEGEVVFDNQLVSGGNGSWDYAPMKLWPQRGSMVFSAYAPFGTASNGIEVVYDDSEEDFQLTYTLPSSKAAQVDLLIADNISVGDVTSRPETVTFDFSHILSLICVNAKYVTVSAPSGTVVEIEELAICGKFIQSADYSASSGWTDQVVMSSDYVYEWNSDDLSVTALSTSYQTVVSPEGGIYAIPYGTAVPLTLYVKYTVEAPGETAEEYEKSGDFSLTLEEGKRYYLNVDIDID